MGEFRYSVKRFHGIDDTHIAQLIFVGAPFGNTTVYVDNFLYNQAASVTAAPTPTVAASK
jgi:hypothetical protein